MRWLGGRNPRSRFLRGVDFLILNGSFETTWAIVTGLLCMLVMAGLAFTGPLALAGVLAVLAVSFGLRWLVTRRGGT